MSKEDMMNRISFALKDPVLQMGFEVICSKLARLEKENAELKANNQFLNNLVREKEQRGLEIQEDLLRENAELKSKNCWKTCEYAEPKSQWISQHIQDVEQLAKAKEIIKEMLSILPKENIEGIYEITEEAEQFLREGE